MRAKELLVVAGISGSGKSTALSALEDLGYFCVDNLPAPLVLNFADYLTAEDAESAGRFALLLDCQDRLSVATVLAGLELVQKRGLKTQILYFDASDEVLFKRFREARRPHPLMVKQDGSSSTILEALNEERSILSGLREKATYLLDSSTFSVHDLKKLVNEYVGAKVELLIVVESFGFKFGLPTDADLVADVRFLPNPHFVTDLRPQTGLEKIVADYVYSTGEAAEFLERYFSLLQFLLPKYIHEGKRYLTIAIGCTGGKHRSVSITEALGNKLLELGLKVVIRHRDLGRE